MKKNPILFYLSFGVLLTANGLLSYASALSLEAKLWVFLLGVVLPCFVLWRFEELPSQGALSFDPGPISAFGLTAAFLLVQITLWLFLKPWPVPDEGLYTYYALELSKHWHFQLYFSQCQSPPIFTWLQSLLFHLITPTLFINWLLTTIAASLSAFFAYKAFRRSLGPSLAFLVCFLFGLSFWGFYIGRYAMPGAIANFLEVFCFFLWARYIQDPRPRNAIALALLLGGGFWFTTVWPVLVVTAAVLFVVNYPPKTWAQHRTLLVGTGALTLLFVVYSFFTGYGAYVSTLLFARQPVDPLKQVLDSFNNFSALFWSCDVQNSYGPIWGGMLNPFLASFFFLGMIHLIRNRKDPVARNILFGFLLLILPGLLTTNFEIFRDAMAVLPLFLIVAWGIQVFLQPLAPSTRLWLLVPFLVLSAGLDTYHLFLSYQNDPNRHIHATQPTYQYLNAWEKLEEQARTQGPGLVFLDLQPDQEDRTLRLGVYPFNAADNPRLDPARCRWAAVIENVHYTPVFKKRFKDCRITELGPDNLWNQGGLILTIFPIAEQDRSTFNAWLQVNQAFHQTQADILFDGTSRDLAANLEKFQAKESLCAGDPFLETFFYEKWFYLERRRNDPAFFETMLQREIQKGLSLPHIWADLGFVYLCSGKTTLARQAFEKAASNPFDRTNAKEDLRQLDALLKKGPAAKPGP